MMVGGQVLDFVLETITDLLEKSPGVYCSIAMPQSGHIVVCHLVVLLVSRHFATLVSGGDNEM